MGAFCEMNICIEYICIFIVIYIYYLYIELRNEIDDMYGIEWHQMKQTVIDKCTEVINLYYSIQSIATQILFLNHLLANFWMIFTCPHMQSAYKVHLRFQHFFTRPTVRTSCLYSQWTLVDLMAQIPGHIHSIRGVPRQDTFDVHPSMTFVGGRNSPHTILARIHQVVCWNVLCDVQLITKLHLYKLTINFTSDCRGKASHNSHHWLSRAIIFSCMDI